MAAAPYGPAAAAAAAAAGGSSSSSPLMRSLSHLLNAQTPELQTLHSLLDLPRDQIALDLSRLEDVLKAELERIVRGRADEVASWRARVEAVRQGQSTSCHPNPVPLRG